MLRENNCQSRIAVYETICFKNEGEISTFFQTRTEFTGKLLLKELLKYMF